MSETLQVVPACDNPRISREQVQEKTQIHCGLHGCTYLKLWLILSLMAQFFSAFIAMLCATAPVSILGTRFGMSIIPFWRPEQFGEPSTFSTSLPQPEQILVPVVGMLSGNSISAVVVSIDYVLKEFVCVSAATTAILLLRVLVVDVFKARTVIRLKYTSPSVPLD